MSDLIKFVPRAALFLAGIAAGALTLSHREGSGMDSAALADLKRSLADMQGRLAEQGSVQTARMDRIETRLDEQAAVISDHTQRLADVPSTGQIVAAMEQLLQKTMASLDERLTTQAHSINVLNTTVAQTDSLLERVLESLDSLQTFGEPPEAPEEAIAGPRPM
jgi:uncharacterized coiled-coil protein SlyX